MTQGRVIPIEGHGRRGNSNRSHRRRSVAPPPKARRGRGGVRLRMPRWSRARWRWLLAIGAALLAGAAIASRISRPLQPPRIFSARALGSPTAVAADRWLDDATRDRMQASGAMKSRGALSGVSLDARAAGEFAGAIGQRRLPNRLPR